MGFSRLKHFFISLFINRTEALTSQAVRYIFVGAIAAFADTGTYALMNKWWGISSAEAAKANTLLLDLDAACGFIMGLIISYTLSVKWVFASRTLANRAHEFAAFAVIGLIGLGLTAGVINAGVSLLNLSPFLAKIVSIVVVFGWNFGARRAILFRGQGSGVRDQRSEVRGSTPSP